MRYVAGIVGVAALAVGGCASEASSAPHVSQPDVVAIDFFAGSTTTATCSGTLLSKNVVLTAAHCAATGSTQGYVRAPDANGQSAAVTLVHVYDWTTDGDHTVEHDLALVVLSKSIEIATYPKVWSHNADGLTALQSRRVGSAALSAATTSSTIDISKGRPVGNALTLLVSDAASDAGGGLFGTDSNGRREVVGVMLGMGKTTNVGYAARVADPGVQNWIANVVANPELAPAAATSTAPTLAKMETLDDDDDDGDVGDDDDDNNDSQSQDSTVDPTQQQSTDPTDTSSGDDTNDREKYFPRFPSAAPADTSAGGGSDDDNGDDDSADSTNSTGAPNSATNPGSSNSDRSSYFQRFPAMGEIAPSGVDSDAPNAQQQQEQNDVPKATFPVQQDVPQS